ncbi:MAG TPA: AAA family ATPase, partial [Alphaproteobacteria bacterium]|nr:AAA family ATPase [Alphaproteobacteria bacterium]
MKPAKTVQNTQIAAPSEPLAAQLRPKSLAEVVGQDHVLAEGGAIYEMVQARHLPSMILWGPPGCGKTTIARGGMLASTFPGRSSVLGQ